jgi:vitamin B12 transporter
MAVCPWRRLAAAIIFTLLPPLVADRAALAEIIDIPEIVVTPNYTATPVERLGSTVSVIKREQIAAMSPASVAQLFRSIPGVTVIETGGPGGTTDVRLRGAETGHTLVLIDGVRVNDFATTRDDFDFAQISPNDIERIEILRGPQSALYGSDAIGGVINIITRKPSPGTSASASVEGGSYGTYAGRLSGSMSRGDLSLRLGGAYFKTDGFSRRGDPDDNEPDGTEKWAGRVNATYAPADGPKVEVGVNAFHQASDYDSFSDPDAPYTVERTTISGFGRLTMPSTEGGVEHSMTAFFLDSGRDNLEPGGSLPVSRFDATSVGAEYQGTKDLGRLGSLLLGSRLEYETARNDAESVSSFPGYESDRTLYAVYGLHQIEPRDDLYLTFGARYDGEIDGNGFLTGRATAAYAMPESETTLRASVGTGAKRPTFYQIANNNYAAAKYPDEDVDTDLQPETSVGVDAGIDQALLGGRVDLSATVFYNRFHDLLAFNSIAFPDGAYENIDRAETAGVEIEATADILPGRLRAGASYTYLYSRDLDTGRPLPRRPEHTAAVDLTLILSERADLTLSGIYVGERFNTSSATTPLPAYGRLDLSARYFLTPETEIFGRIENLTDADYEDPAGYNTTGLSAYVGLRWVR